MEKRTLYIKTLFFLYLILLFNASRFIILTLAEYQMLRAGQTFSLYLSPPRANDGIDVDVVIIISTHQPTRSADIQFKLSKYFK